MKEYFPSSFAQLVKYFALNSFHFPFSTPEDPSQAPSPARSQRRAKKNKIANVEHDRVVHAQPNGGKSASQDANHDHVGSGKVSVFPAVTPARIEVVCFAPQPPLARRLLITPIRTFPIHATKSQPKNPFRVCRGHEFGAIPAAIDVPFSRRSSSRRATRKSNSPSKSGLNRDATATATTTNRKAIAVHGMLACPFSSTRPHVAISRSLTS